MAKPFIDFTQTALVTGAELAKLALRPLPVAPDGRYDYEALATGEGSQGGGDDAHSRLYNLISNAQAAAGRGPIITNPQAPRAAVDAILHKDAIDDRTGAFTTALGAITRLPPGKLQDTLNDEAIALLYKTLPHPPATFLGPEWQFRAADGSGNNPEQPELGKSGTRYARSVQGKHPLPANVLPDPGLVFDLLLKARDFKEHPGRNSSLTFAFASIVTHSLFRTDSRDWSKNNTTSYLDLSPLYGFDQLTQDQVRDKEKGRGLLYPDTFSEDRLGFVPPAASALLVILSRNHNYVANMLLKTNERGRWSDPPPEDPKKRAEQDEEIFQTARLVNCGHFISLIFGDYVAGFLGLGRDGCTWSMNPFDPIVTQEGETISRGQGNQCSVEFNVLYRWHATTAREDIKWTENEFQTLFNGKALTEVTLEDFKEAAVRAFSSQEPDPKKRTFAGLKRQADGSFADDDLAGILHDATEKCAGAYRARGTPEALRIIEIMGIRQAREWGCCTMNEFRKFLGLKQFSSFEEWSSRPEIVTAARQLYGHIDNLELYPGLQAEDCMDLGPGSGICCGYTMTRAILADAIALVRGDRFYTVDYTPHNLTAWGIQDCVRDPNNGAFGAELPKLLMRHLPRHYPADNVYGLFPFFVPDVTKQNLKKLGIADKYKYNRPVATPAPKVLNTLTGIRYVFNDFKKFKQIYTADMEMLTEGYGFMLTFDDEKKHSADRAFVWHALFPDMDTYKKNVEWFKSKARLMLKEKSVKYDGVPGTYVDIIRDVVNLVSVHWAADKLCGIPLKTKANPRGLFTEQEVYDMFTILFMCVFENIAPEHGWALRSGAQQVGKIVNGLIEKSLADAAPHTSSSIIGRLGETVKDAVVPNHEEYTDFLARLASSGRPTNQLVACVVGLAVGSSVNYAQAVAQVVDFYFNDARARERAQIIELSKRPDGDKKADELLRGYVREAMRLNPQFGGLFRAVAADDAIPQGDGFEPMQVKAGDLLFGSFKNAHLNPADFPNPTTVDPTRPKDKYQLQGAGFHNCPGVDFAADTIPQIVKIIFSLPNVRPAAPPAGVCASFDLNQFETDNRMYVSSTGNVTPWPGSLQLVTFASCLTLFFSWFSQSQSRSMQGDVGLGIELAPPSYRVAFPAGVVTSAGKLKRSHQSDDIERRAMSDADARSMSSRRRKTVHEESQSRTRTRSRTHSHSGQVEHSRHPAHSRSQTLVAMRSSKAMDGLLLAEAGASMVEMNRLSSGEAVSRFRQGKPIEPGAVTPLTMSASVAPVMPHQAVSKVRPRLYSEHVRNMSVDHGLFRHGTLLSSAPTSPLRRAEQLSILLGNGSGKVKPGAVVPPHSKSITAYPNRNKSKSSPKDIPDAVAFEQGRSRVRVALDIELENNIAVEGGYISGTLLIRVHPKRKDDILKLGGGKVRIAGFEVAPKNEDRCVFYQVTAPLANISRGYDRLYTTGVDREGFGNVAEGEYGVRFAMQIPLVSSGGKPRGVPNNRSGSGATIKYIIIASMKVVDPSTGKRSIAHFYRDCEVWPALDPVATLAPAPDPMLARAAKKLFMGGDGTLALTASLHRSTWVAGQPVHVRLRIVNETKKNVRSISFAVIRTTTLFKLNGNAHRGGTGYDDDDMDEGETNTHERRVAEVALTAGQKGAKGRASAKGWWTGVAPGEMRNVTHSITLPSDALTIPRARLVEVDYAIRVALGVSSIAGNSEAVHVTLPIRVVNFISLDPPPSEPIMSVSPTSVIELDTPRQEKYSDLDFEETATMESLSDVSTDGHCGEEVTHTKLRGILKRARASTLPRNAKLPSSTFPAAHTVHDLGSMEDADDLNGVLGDIPGSVSILEETDITIDAADSGYSEGGCSNRSDGFGCMRRTKNGYLNMQGHTADVAEEEYHDSFEDGAEEGDIGSDEELEKMVGCASARIDSGAFQYLVVHPEPAYRSSSSEAIGGGYIVREPAAVHSSGRIRAVRGPRNMSVKRADGQQQRMSTAMPYEQSLPTSHTILQVANPTNYAFTESPESMYTLGNPGVMPSHASTSPPKHLRSSPSKPTVLSSRNSGLPRPSASRSSTAPTDATGSSHDSGYSSGLSASPTRTIAGLPITNDNASRMSPVRARIAALEMKSLEREGLANEYEMRPSHVSRSLTMNAVRS
ncbi:hypothetical protein ACEPAF_4219 [Sanghuangporus sanghuang]